MARKKKVMARVADSPPSRARLKTISVLLYFLTVLVYILFTLSIGERLFRRPDGSLPDSLYLPIVIWYYVVPFVLAGLFGVLFRPFWKNFRDILFSIFYVSVVYSFAAYMVRCVYSDQRLADIRQSQLARIRVEDARHTMADENRDGRVERVDFTVRFFMDDFPAGEYRLDAFVADRPGAHPSRQIGSFCFPVPGGQGHEITGHFRYLPQADGDRGLPGESDLNLVLHRIMPISSEGRRVLACARWAPFFRVTGWDGTDPDIQAGPVVLDILKVVDFFTLPSGPSPE